MNSGSHRIDIVDGKGLALSYLIEVYLKAVIPDSSLHQLWCSRYVVGNVLVLPEEKAIAIAEFHERGYHHGLWNLATQYEKFMAMALLVNSNSRVSGFGDPKRFSAWWRRDDLIPYKAAADFRKSLNQKVAFIAPDDRRRHWLNYMIFVNYIII